MSDAEQTRPAPLITPLSPNAADRAAGDVPRTRHPGALGRGSEDRPQGDLNRGHAGEDHEGLTVLRPTLSRAERIRMRRKAIEDRTSAAVPKPVPADDEETNEEKARSFVARAAPRPPVFENTSNVEQLLLPSRASKRRGWATPLTFVLFVVLPTVVAAVYYIVFASNQYVAEFRFAVREVSQGGGGAGAATAGIASLFGMSGGTSSPSDNFMVADYLTSHQIVNELQSKIKVRSLYSRNDIDWWSRFDPSQSMEKFLNYWQTMVTANYDQVTGIATARVRAFSADDAYLIATTMVSQAEKLVNDISMRPRLDAVKYAEEEVNRSEDKIRNIRAQLSQYRNKESVIDPTSNVVTSNTTLAQTLRTTLMQYETELATLTKLKLTSNAPYIINLRTRINAAREQLAAVEAQIATSKNGERPLSAVVGEYEKLTLDLQFAQTILTSAVQALEQARVSAMTQQLYITPYVRPTRPDSSTYPNRTVSILTVALACFFAWTICLLIVRSIREHLA